MRAKGCLFSVWICAALFGCTVAYAQKPLLISGALDGLNQSVKIALNKTDGRGLVVWSQGKAGANSYGRIYAAELTPQSGGSYTAGAPMLISANSGSNQRPSVMYLSKLGKYLITWDTSFRDLRHFLELDPIDGRPFPPSDVLARTYTPASTGATQGTLGNLLKLNDTETVLAAIPGAFQLTSNVLETGEAAVDKAFITFLGSTEGGEDGHNWAAGLWGARCEIQKKGSPDLSVPKRVQMSSWDLIATAPSGFSAGGKIYAAGIRLDALEYYENGRGGVFRIKPDSFKVEQFITTSPNWDPHKKAPPLKTYGQVTPLDAPAQEADEAASADFRIVGLSNVDLNILVFSSDMSAASFKKVGSVAGANTIVDQRFFTITDTLKGTRQVYVLYHTTKQMFMYRALSSATGAPTGASVKALNKISGPLIWMDTIAVGRDVLVVYSQKKSDSLYEVYFNRFAVP
ncbi:MAG: hypothetical protein AB1714_04675 [Acidobacteriota bacterium]